jgi:peptidoglycan/xylan/chitin deacetylase (PgdA/CDA1 family)
MVHVDRLATVFVAQPLLRAGVLRARPGIPILMYHSVSDDPEPGVAPYYRLVTGPARFRAQMRWLKDAGYRVTDLATAVERISHGVGADERLAVITFDDGFRDFHTHAWPVLSDFGFTATMFLATACIADVRRSFRNRECLTWSEVRELRAAGARFGSHTVTHPKLHGMAWPDIRRELEDSRAALEHALQERIDTFAYPYAFPREDRAFAARFAETLAATGYTLAVTTVIGRADAGSHRLRLERLPVNEADDRALFTTKLAGAYDWLGVVQRIIRGVKRTRRSGEAA